MPIKVIDGHSLSSRPITHETRSLDVTTNSHTSKVVFNEISFLKNLVIIELFWLILHNLRVDCHMRSLHFETPQHEALECETFVRSMQNLKQMEDLNGIKRLRGENPLRCITHDKKAQSLLQYFLTLYSNPHKTNESKIVKFFKRNIFWTITILDSIIIIHKCVFTW